MPSTWTRWPRAPPRPASRWTQVQTAHVRRWMAQLHGAGREPRGIALVLSCWRSFYRWLGHEGLIEVNPVQDVRAPKAGRPLPKALAVDDAVQLADLHDAEADPWTEARDRAIVELLYGCGLRVGELVDLDVRASRRRAAGSTSTRAKRTCSARAASARIVPVGGKAAEALAAWLAVRDDGPRDGGGAAARSGRCARRCSSAATARASRRTRSGSMLKARSAQGRAGRAGASAHAAAFVREPRAAVQQRPARRAGTARPRQHHDHPGLHAAGFPAPGQGLRRGASARQGDARAGQGGAGGRVRSPGDGAPD